MLCVVKLMCMQKKEYIYGRHALVEALQNAPHTIGKVFLAPRMNDAELLGLLKQAGIEPRELTADTTKVAAGERGSHQGVVAEFFPQKLLLSFDDFSSSLEVTPHTSLVLLDELTDPHNVGAILRSAAAFGVSGVLLPTQGTAPLSGAVIKVSVGMAFRIPLISVADSVVAMQTLKDMGFRVYALDMHGTTKLAEATFSKPALFIVGNEGRGVSAALIATCDETLSIPMDPRCESLNAAVSTGIALYQWASAQR